MKERLAIWAGKMKNFFHVDHFFHDPGLADISRNAVEHERVDVGFKFVRVDRGVDGRFPKLDRDVVGHELTFARIFQKRFADFRARVDGAKYVATSAMIITWDRAKRFALRAFTAAGRTKKEKGLVFHHDEIAYNAKGTGPASTVIPSKVEESRGVTGS